MADPTARFVLTATDKTGAAIASADRNLKTLSRTANSVRSMFGFLGVAVTGRVFINWIGGALKAAEATGEHAAAIRSAQETMQSMKKASDELAISLGVQLVPAMQAVSAVMIGWNRIISRADPFPFEAQIERVKEQLEAIKGIDLNPRDDGRRNIYYTADQKAEIERLTNDLNELIKKQEQALGMRTDASTTRINSAISGLRMLRTEGLKTADVNIDWLTEPDGLQEIIVEARQMTVDELLKPFPAAEVAKMFEPIREESGFAAAELGMNFKSAFDGWLIDGERGFKDLLKRMAISMTTSALFQGMASLFPGGSFFSSFFGGSRASTGSVREGMMYKVHPGEAFFTPGQDGHVGKTGGGSAINIVNNIDARGADASLANRLPAILEQNNRRIKAELAHDRNRGR